MKAFFDRTAPFFITDKPGFFANPVEIPREVLTNLRNFAELLKDMNDLFLSHGSPEKCAQEEADFLVNEIQQLFKKRKA